MLSRAALELLEKIQGALHAAYPEGDLLYLQEEATEWV